MEAGQRHGREVDVLSCGDAGQHLLGLNDAKQPVQTAIAHRKPGVLRLDEALQVVCCGKLDVDEHHIGARGHQRACLAIVEAKDISRHFLFMLLDDTCSRAFFQHGVDFLFRHAGVLVWSDTQETQQTVSRCRQQHDKRPHHHSQQLHGPGHEPRDGFWRDLSEALGHQLADDDGDICHHHHDQGGGTKIRCFPWYIERLQPK